MNPGLAALRALLAVGSANLASELAYILLVAPRFGSLGEVPLYVWALLYLPVLFAAMWAARGTWGVGSVLAAGVTAGAAAQLTKWALAYASVPGFAAQEPVLFKAAHFGRMTVGFVVLFALIVAARRLTRRP